MVIGVTDEDPKLVSKWVREAKPTYPVAILKNAEAFENFINLKGFPTAAVLDPEGRIVFAGYSGDSEGSLKDAQAQAKKLPLWPKSLGKVVKLVASDLPKAYGELRALEQSGKLPPEDQPVAQQVRSYLEGRASDSVVLGRKLREDGYLLRAARSVELYANAQPPFPATEDAAALLKEVQALPDYKREAAGGEAFEEAIAFGDEAEYSEAFDAFRSIAKKYEGTKIAEKARAEAEEIRTSGLIGYEKACESCGKARRACEKHRKDVKL